MSFSLLSRGAFLPVAFLLALSGCSLQIGEQVDNPSLRFGSQEMNCLEGGTQTLVDFFQGDADAKRVGALWDCMGRSLELFSELTRGEEPGLYSDRELRNFMERYFLTGTKISDPLLRSLMILKRTLLGGRPDGLTESEIREARALLGVIKEQTLRLKPHLPLTVEHFSKMSESEIQEALATLESVASEIGKHLRGAGQAYEFVRFGELLEELEKLASPGAAASIRELRTHLPLLQRVKAILLSRDHLRIRNDEWESFLSISGRWFGLYLRFACIYDRYVSAPAGTDLKAETREQLLLVGQDVKDMLIEAVGRRADGVIPFSELDALVESVDARFFMIGDKTLQRAHVKPLIRILIQRALGGRELGETGRGAIGLTQAAIQRGWRLAEDWGEAQRFLDLLFAKLVREATVADGNQARYFERGKLLSVSLEDLYRRAGRPLSRATQAAAERMREVIRTQPPLYRGESDEIFFDSKVGEGDPDYSYHGLSLLNYMSVLGELLVEAYAEDPERMGVKVTEAEVDRLYWDLRDVGLDLKLFDPNNDTVPKKRFQEANLFTFAGDGDEFMDAREATEILAYMISAKNVTGRVHNAIASACRPAGGSAPEIDFWGFPIIEAACFRRIYFGRYAEMWSEMPRLREYYRKLKLDPQRTKELSLFERGLETVARKEGYSASPFTSADTDTMTGVVQYVETIFIRFDRDGSDTINLWEAIEGEDAAFRVFRGALAQASGLGDDLRLKAAFSYLLAYGQVPTTAEALWWMGKGYLIGWEFEADRGRLVQILAELAGRLRYDARLSFRPEAFELPRKPNRT